MKSNVSRLAGALALSLFASLAAAAVDAPAGAQSARLIVNRAAYKTNAEVGRIVDAFRRAVDDQA